ncbi:ATP-dependent DNA helicase pif1-like [Daphnia magna]|uniref:ATP-dependent DNA helicase pif1-like n=1 Tax=Daphnia magna TaxID=35525 RepID=UPI001E1BBF6B|nr:ATP-dependent DNA helicase pif1-like [Daphnia magna]
MEEAAAFEMPVQLRQLFVDICCHCRPTNAQLLFNNNLQHLTEDYQRNGHGEEVAKNLALKWIQDKIVQNGEKYEDFELPIPDFQLIDRLISAEIEENDENVQRQKKLRGEMMMAKLNVGQRAAFDQIMTAINDENSPQSRQFFLDGPGGTGKTFLYNTLINVLQGEGKKIIAVASTGIASTLLIDGATYHSQFKIYPPITETTRSKIEEHHFSAKLIRDAALIIEDEATVMTNHALNAIKHVTKKVTKNNKPYGNKVLLLGGDFRQCLPVVKHGNQVKVVEATIKNCESWSTFRHLRLTENMRTTAGSQEYANWLIELGNGTLPTTANLSSDVVEIPPDFLITEEYAKSLNITGDDQDPRINALIHHVFGDPKHLLDQDISEEVNSRAILCPKNDECLKINNAIIKNMPGEQCVYKSIDTITGDEEEVANFPTEFLNTLKISGIPPHTLKLKVGAIIMLLKNIDSRRGLCNGTRLVIKQLRQNVIVAAISSGKNKGLCVFK